VDIQVGGRGVSLLFFVQASSPPDVPPPVSRFMSASEQEHGLLSYILDKAMVIYPFFLVMHASKPLLKQ
jgi:hypothetical protein